MGGEKNKELEGVWLPMGSPPRGRGKVEAKDVFDSYCRITPAWAGKRQAERQGRFCPRDHPRVGGEKHIANFNDETGTGSPPRGRGKGWLCGQCF